MTTLLLAPLTTLPPPPAHMRAQVVGYLLLRPTQVQAVLPPPLPSTAPFRMYIEALAVLPGHRRQGVGAALLRAALQLGKAQPQLSVTSLPLCFDWDRRVNFSANCTFWQQLLD